MIICRESSIHSSLSVNSDPEVYYWDRAINKSVVFLHSLILKPNFLLVQCFLALISGFTTYKDLMSLAS